MPGKGTSGRLGGRVAVIIGAARGIGAGIARRFVEEGARLVIADTEREAGLDMARVLGEIGQVHFRPADVSREEDVQALVTEAEKRYGRLDIMVQNAGIYPWTLIENTSPEEWDRVMAVNLKGCFLAAKSALAPMRRQRYGRIVFTSSITGPRVTSPGHGHYSASKGGINAFIKAAALEFAGHGITVNGVEPGNILTEGMQALRSPAFIQSMAAMIPLGALGQPRDIANAVLYLASEEAGYVTGITIVVDGGQTLPEGADFKLSP
jgi:3-oxoacyl-[acyl-carrier protein] reductase